MAAVLVDPGVANAVSTCVVGSCEAVIVVDADKTVDFFISHAGRDRAWAEWVAAQLREADWSVELDSTDWATGEDFMAHIEDALDRCKAMVALWSPAYFAEGSFALRELRAADLAKIRIVPFRVEKFDPPPLWRHLIYQDLFAGDGEQARHALAAAVAGPQPWRSQLGQRRRPYGHPMSSRRSRSDNDLLDKAALDLAQEVRFQCREEVAYHGLAQPVAIKIQWFTREPTEFSQPDMNLDLGAPLRPRRHGDVSEVANVFRDLESRQLLVLGGQASGKSILALLLTLGLVEANPPYEPTPGTYG